jgi:hypothetical protein
LSKLFLTKVVYEDNSIGSINRGNILHLATNNINTLCGRYRVGYRIFGSELRMLVGEDLEKFIHNSINEGKNDFLCKFCLRKYWKM